MGLKRWRITDFDHLIALDFDLAVAQLAHELEELAVLELLARVIGDALEELACCVGHFVVVMLEERGEGFLWVFLLLFRF